MTVFYAYGGEIACFVASLVWAGTVCSYRYFGEPTPAYALNLFKNAVALVCLAITLVVVGCEFPRDPWIWVSLGLSGWVGIAISDTLSYLALLRLGALVTAAGLCLGPPFSSLLARSFLGETLNFGEWSGIALTILSVFGVVYLNHRNLSARSTLPRKEITLGILALLCSALAHALGVVLGRYGLQRTDVLMGTTLRIFPTFLLLAGISIFDRRPILKSLGPGKRFLILSVTAFAGSYVGLILMSVGLKFAKAGVATAILGTYPIWVVPIARHFLHEESDLRTLLFVLLAVLGICLMVFAKH